MENQNSTHGIGILGLLGILFIGLKLTGYITWSWIWVLAPFWLGFAVLVVFVIGWIAIVAAIQRR